MVTWTAFAILAMFLFSSSMWLALIIDPCLFSCLLRQFLIFVFNLIDIDSRRVLHWGCFQSFIMTLIMMILYYFIDHCDWYRCLQGVTLGVFSIMYLILVILMTRSFLNEVGLALIVINIISVIIIVIIIIITIILIIIVTVNTVFHHICNRHCYHCHHRHRNYHRHVTVIRCTWSSSPMLSSHPSLA